MNKNPDVDKYIKKSPKEAQKMLTTLRTIIEKNVPKDTQEVLSYGMPAYKHGRVIVYFACHKSHIGLYPYPTAIKGFEKELEKYKTSKSTAQFPFGTSIPVALIAKIIKFRVKENLEKEKPKNSKLSKKHVVYHKDGSIWAKGKIVGDTYEGYWEWFRKNGTKMRSGYLRKGKQIGRWTTYDKKGKVYKVTEIK